MSYGELQSNLSTAEKGRVVKRLLPTHGRNCIVRIYDDECTAHHFGHARYSDSGSDGDVKFSDIPCTARPEKIIRVTMDTKDDKGNHQFATIRYFGTCFEMDGTKPSVFHARRNGYNNQASMPDELDINDMPLGTEYDYVREAARNGQIWHVSMVIQQDTKHDQVNMKRSLPVVTGVHPDELKAWVSKLQTGRGGLTKKQELVARLYTSTFVEVFAMVEEHCDLTNFINFSQVVTFANANYGDWWPLALQAENFDLSASSLDLNDLYPPAWLGKAWRVEYSGSGNKEWKREKVQLIAWNSMRALARDAFPSPATLAFEMKLARSRELFQTHLRVEKHKYLDALFLGIFWLRPGHGHDYDDANDTANKDGEDTAMSDAPIVTRTVKKHNKDVYMITLRSSRFGSAAGSVTVPEVGTRIVVSIQPKNDGVVRFSGIVQQNILTNVECLFMVVASPPAGYKRVISPKDEYEVRLDFPEDNTSDNRAVNALNMLFKNSAPKRGVQMKSVAFGLPVAPEINQNFYANSIRNHKNNKVEYIRQTEEFVKTANIEQQQIVNAPIAEKGTGLVLINGPPGTGKTAAVAAVARGLQAIGDRIVVTAPSNAAVKQFQEKYLSTAMIFTGDQNMIATQEKWSELRAVRFSSPLARLPTSKKSGVKRAGHSLLKDIRLKPQAWNSSRVGASTGDSMDIDNPEEDAEQKELDQANQDNEQILEECFVRVGLSALDKRGYESSIDFNSQKLKYAIIMADEEVKRPKPVQGKFTLSPEEQHFNRAINNAKEFLALFDKLQAIRMASSERRELSKRFRELDEETAQDYLQLIVRVVFVTNNSASHDFLAQWYKPKVWIQDETGQSDPTDTFIPAGTWQNHLQFVMWLGDKYQLKPVLTAHAASETASVIANSMLKYLIDWQYNPHTVIRLVKQYRMHPHIANFVNQHVYSKSLVNQPITIDEGSHKAFDSKVLGLFGATLRSFGYKGQRVIAVNTSAFQSENVKDTTTVKNSVEALAVTALMAQLVAAGVGHDEMMGIAPYNGQNNEIRNTIFGQSEQKSLRRTDITSVEASQGQERKIVLESLALNHGGDPRLRTHFLAESERIVVASTRAQRFFIVFGNFGLWRAAINQAGGRNPEAELRAQHLGDWKDRHYDIFIKWIRYLTTRSEEVFYLGVDQLYTGMTGKKLPKIPDPPVVAGSRPSTAPPAKKVSSSNMAAAPTKFKPNSLRGPPPGSKRSASDQ